MMKKIWNWIGSWKRLREENKSLRERIKALEKKEKEMQILNVNLVHEKNRAVAIFDRKYTQKVTSLERKIERARQYEQQLKDVIEEKKLANQQRHNIMMEAQKEVKELRLRIAQMEAENRQKKKT
jgi:hypothetical protein